MTIQFTKDQKKLHLGWRSCAFRACMHTFPNTHRRVLAALEDEEPTGGFDEVARYWLYIIELLHALRHAQPGVLATQPRGCISQGWLQEEYRRRTKQEVAA